MENVSGPRRLIPTDSLFFGLFPELPAAERIESFTRKLCVDHGVIGRPLATRRFHVSLHHCGNYRGLPPEVVALAEQAAATVAVPPFDLTFDYVMGFAGRPGNQPLVLSMSQEAHALTALYQKLGEALKQTMPSLRITSRFKPHLTLLYGDHRVAQPIEPISWTVRDFVLVHSLLGKTRYIPLARWPLTG